MNSLSLPWAAAALLLAHSAGGCAQGDPVPFGTAPTTDATAGKSWYAPMFLEPNPNVPSVSSAYRNTVNGFDAAAYGTQAYLAASFYDGLSGHFNGYVRKYDQTNGWSGPGPDFVTIANTVDMGYAGITSNPSNGVFMSVFSPKVDPGNGGALFYTSFSLNGVWAQARAQRSASGTFPAWGSGVEQGFGSVFSPLFESTGRVLLPFVSNATTPKTTIEVADPSTGINTTSSAEYAITTAATGAGYPLRKVSTLNDGQNRICFVNEDVQAGVRGVYSRCLSDSGFQVTSPSFTPALTGGATQITAATGYGFDAATDSNGTVMVVYYGGTSSYGVYSRKMVSGTWDSSSTQLDSGFSTLGMYGLPQVLGAPTGPYTGTAPAVAHLGSGVFLAAWVAVAPSGLLGQGATLPPSDQIMYEIYQPGSGWGSPSSIAASEAYTARPHIENIRLFSNGNGSAMLAATWISSEETRPPNSTLNDTRKTLVSRFELSTATWQTFTTLGNGCTPLVYGDTADNPFLEGCTSAPRGFVFPNGAALVIYQDQDNSGNYRLATAEYR